MTEKKISESSIARMAGNIASGFLDAETLRDADTAYLRSVAKDSVLLARFIAEQVEKTAPKEKPHD